MIRILHKKAIYKTLGITIALGAFFIMLFLRFAEPMQSDWQNGGMLYIKGKQSIELSFAQTPELRHLGLSGTQYLKPNTGLLFVFDAPEKPGFWMKDMKYPIDIVWIDARKRVVAILAHVSPESYPNVFYPPSDIMYVLEVNAGQTQMLGILEGTKIDFAVNY